MAKRKAKQASHARKSGAKTTKAASTGSKAKAQAKAVVKASRKKATEKADSRPVDQRSGHAEGWHGETLARMRALILEADSEMVEERKWRKPSNGMAGIPVWSYHGIVCTGETYKQVVKLTFAKGASVPDPSRLFNSSLEGNTRRAIDIHEGEQVNAAAFKALVKAAVAINGLPKKR